MTEHANLNALSYWLPKIEAAGLPVPKTIIVEMDEPTWWGMLNSMNGERAPDGADPLGFFERIGVAADIVGWPAFLRTDHTSHKHNWKNTCFLERRSDIASHVFEIAEFSEICGIGVDLSWRNWAVREMLPVEPLGICHAYGGMPVVREFRFFVDNGIVRCGHPYWPEAALNEGGVQWLVPLAPTPYEALCRDDGIWGELTNLASRAGTAVGGSWSVDILETRRGWMITDMALAEDSYHWPDCPNTNALSRPAPAAPELNPADLLKNG